MDGETCVPVIATRSGCATLPMPSLIDAAAAIGEGMGKVAQPLRVAMTGTQVSPSIDHTVYLAGRERALRRIEDALAKASA